MAVRNSRITRGKLGDISFQLNPTEFTHDDGAVWGEITSPGMKRPITTYSYGRAGTYAFTLYFNKRYYRSVDIPKIKAKLHGYRTGKTPILFTYMGYTDKVVITECVFQILSLDSSLVPTELSVSITLKRIYN